MENDFELLPQNFCWYIDDNQKVHLYILNNDRTIARSKKSYSLNMGGHEILNLSAKRFNERMEEIYRSVYDKHYSNLFETSMVGGMIQKGSNMIQQELNLKVETEVLNEKIRLLNKYKQIFGVEDLDIVGNSWVSKDAPYNLNAFKYCFKEDVCFLVKNKTMERIMGTTFNTSDLHTVEDLRRLQKEVQAHGSRHGLEHALAPADAAGAQDRLHAVLRTRHAALHHLPFLRTAGIRLVCGVFQRRDAQSLQQRGHLHQGERAEVHVPLLLQRPDHPELLPYDAGLLLLLLAGRHRLYLEVPAVAVPRRDNAALQRRAGDGALGAVHVLPRHGLPVGRVPAASHVRLGDLLPRGLDGAAAAGGIRLEPRVPPHLVFPRGGAPRVRAVPFHPPRARGVRAGGVSSGGVHVQALQHQVPVLCVRRRPRE